MTDIYIEVQPAEGGWRIQRRLNPLHWHGDNLISYPAVYKWKWQAVLVGTFLAKWEKDCLPEGDSVELTIKNRKGRITEKNTYGYDPERTKG